MPSRYPVLQPESPEAKEIYDLFMQVLGISAGIFVIVAGLIFIAIVRGRKFRDLPKQEFGSHRREIYWMIIPVLIVLWITAISAKIILTMNAIPKIDPPDGTEPELIVIGHQWWWEIHYPEEGIVAANEIHIPVSKNKEDRIRVKLTSADVIHCFWVPQLARKIDVIPGRENYIWLQASTPGVYQGRCAEFCGNQHAWMGFQVFALEEQEYADWIASRKEPPGNPTDADALAGQKIFFDQMCVNCHAIQGTEAVATIGPDLTHVAARKELGGGVIENSAENLRRWLHNPQAIKPGCHMPNFKLSEEQVRQLAAYLESIN